VWPESTILAPERPWSPLSGNPDMDESVGAGCRARPLRPSGRLESWRNPICNPRLVFHR